MLRKSIHVICQKLLDHDDPHKAENGMTWELIYGKVIVSYKKYEKELSK